MELGPVDPWQPPRTLAHTTKKRRVSTAFPGPIRLFHQPGLASDSECQPAQWWSPLSAWQTRTALSLVEFRAPYVSYRSVKPFTAWPLLNVNDSGCVKSLGCTMPTSSPARCRGPEAVSVV